MSEIVLLLGAIHGFLRVYWSLAKGKMEILVKGAGFR
jgi:hypothetical protein